MSFRPRYAIDFDGTLATYEHWTAPDDLGQPVPRMVERVVRMLSEGKEVVIFTARVWHDHTLESIKVSGIARSAIYEWCEKHLGRRLEVTNIKDPGMVEIWDDRCVQVRPNTGEIVDVIRRTVEVVFE